MHPLLRDVLPDAYGRIDFRRLWSRSWATRMNANATDECEAARILWDKGLSCSSVRFQTSSPPNKKVASRPYAWSGTMTS